jgi:hypothetical protein
MRQEVVMRHPEAKPTPRRMPLDQSHGGTGVHAGALDQVRGMQAFEGISLYQRGGWFVASRSTIGPASNLACEQRIRDAVRAMQVPET